MTFVVVVLLIVVAILAAAMVVLLIERARHIRAERALRESAEKFRKILDSVPIMIWTAQKDISLDYVNFKCMEFSGLPIERVLGEGWFDAVHPEDVGYCLRTYAPSFETHTPFLIEYRVRRADGAYRWMLGAGVPRYGPDGDFAGFIGCDVDITERKEAEEQIRESRHALEVSHREIQQLAGRLIEAQDAERARIARDLHDDVSQQLAGLSIALSGLKRRMDELHVAEDLQADLRTLHQRAATLAQNVRHLSHDLHPTVLRHAGLVAALSSYCAELERTHGTVISCSAEGDFEAIAPGIALCLYRIAQESLRNVVAHAGASRADVRLRLTGDHVEITIVDDGKGFDARPLMRGKGLGLVSITERVRLAGGTVSVGAGSRNGTCVHASIPAHPLARNDAGSGAENGRPELSFS